MRAKRVVLVGGLVLATALGVAGGYYTGVLTKPPYPVASGVPAPLGQVSAAPITTPLPIKKPKKSDFEPLKPNRVDFHRLIFVIDLDKTDLGDPPPVRLSVRVPIDWTDELTDKGEIKLSDPFRARWIRLSVVYPVKQSAKQKRDQLVPTLRSSIAHEDDFRLIGQSDDQITGTDERPRQVSTLRYSYIPDEWLRPIIVQYVATAGQPGANIEMAFTGLSGDEAAMTKIADQAAKSVELED